MSAEEKMYKFLAQPENITVAFQVSNLLDRLKRQVHEDFWEAFSEYINESIASSEWKDNWTFAPILPGDRRKRWSWCAIRPTRNVPVGKHLLQATVQQSSVNDGFQLLMGAMWYPRLGGKSTDVEVKELKEFLKQMGYSQVSPDWPNWGWTNYRIYSPEFISQMMTDRENFVPEVGDAFWQFFLKVQPYLEDINRQII